MFRAVNKREIGGRGHELLERIKTEIKNDLILTESGVTPEDLIGAFVELTGKLVAATDEIGKLQAKVEASEDLLKMEIDAESRQAKKLAKDIAATKEKIEMNKKIAEFCNASINAAVIPVIK